MNFMELQNCPACNSSNASISRIVTLMDGVRYDEVRCLDCDTQWKFYYKISDAQIEVISRGANAPECTCEECRNKKSIENFTPGVDPLAENDENALTNEEETAISE